MRADRPELRIITISILLGTLALALAIVIGYAWWSTQRGLTRHVQEKVDIIAQFLENGMALLPEGAADLDGLHLLMEQVGEDNGARQMAVARGPATARQYGPSRTPYVPDDHTQRAFQTGQDVIILETRDGRRTVRRLKVLEASPSCLGCHEAAPGEILGVLDVSFDLARVQSAGPDFYRNLLLVSLLVSVITVLLVFLVFSRVNMARRIEGVATLAGDIASGNLDRRVTSLPGTDMDGLARAVNEMAGSLQAQQEALACQQRELEEANRRLEVLVQESHHRIKNNLQTVADLLSLQSTGCPLGVGNCLQDSIQRVKSIATVHELLSVEQTESTDIQQLAERLLNMAVRNTASPGQQIAHSVNGDSLRLASKQATALALILSELFNNALLHGLADRPAGQIGVDVRASNGQVVLTVRDDGAGLPPGFSWEANEQLGLRIVRTLVKRELQGEFSLQNVENGTAATVTFPHPLEHKEWNP
jgi:two-component sensor histidine kinase